MDYKQKSQEIRQAMKPIREFYGNWLIADMKRFWMNGGTEYNILPGTYIIEGPVPIPAGGIVDGSGCTIQSKWPITLADYNTGAETGK